MPEIWRWSNLGLAFVVELVALGIFAFWRWRTGGSTPVRLLLAVGLPLLTAIIWGFFAAPTADHGSPGGDRDRQDRRLRPGPVESGSPRPWAWSSCWSSRPTC
jgi:hypothetical protein